MSPILSKLSRWLTLLFIISLFFLTLHVVDDALSLGEPEEWGVSIPEFLLIVASVYLVVPPLGVILARRGHASGYLITLLYALQAFYGAGVNHVRHMLGDFGGLGLTARLLSLAGLELTDVRGHGFLTGVLGMLGLGHTEPHGHSLGSSLVAIIDIVVNIPLGVICLIALWHIYRSSRRAPMMQQ